MYKHCTNYIHNKFIMLCYLIKVITHRFLITVCNPVVVVTLIRKRKIGKTCM